MFIVGPGCCDVKERIEDQDQLLPGFRQYSRGSGGLQVCGKYWQEVIRAGEIVRITLYRRYFRACTLTRVLYSELPKPRGKMFLLVPDCNNVEEYLEKCEKASPEPGHCPVCGRHLRKHDHYWRWVVHANGLVSIPLYRAYCPNCRKTGVLYPAFLRPHARYESILREKVLRAHFEGQSWSQAARETFSSSEEVPRHRTLRRWVRDLVEKAPDVNEILAMWLARWEPHFDQRGLWPEKGKAVLDARAEGLKVREEQVEVQKELARLTMEKAALELRVAESGRVKEKTSVQRKGQNRDV